jgi:hypothetical protein
VISFSLVEWRGLAFPRTGRATRARCLNGAFVALATFAGCGADVDLGGPSIDAGTLDAGPPGGQCAPCASASGCASGTCGQFAGDLFCGTVCTSVAQCGSAESCTAVTSTTGASVMVCVPTSGVCTPASAPAATDGAALDHCGTLNGPPIASPCNACGKFSNDCQPNGCYGGYWCNEATRDCSQPPTTCP